MGIWHQTATLLAQGQLGTRGLQGWIQDNIVPLLLLGIAVIMLWICLLYTSDAADE